MNEEGDVDFDKTLIVNFSGVALFTSRGIVLKNWNPVGFKMY